MEEKTKKRSQKEGGREIMSATHRSVVEAVMFLLLLLPQELQSSMVNTSYLEAVRVKKHYACLRSFIAMLQLNLMCLCNIMFKTKALFSEAI